VYITAITQMILSLFVANHSLEFSFLFNFILQTNDCMW